MRRTVCWLAALSALLFAWASCDTDSAREPVADSASADAAAVDAAAVDDTALAEDTPPVEDVAELPQPFEFAVLSDTHLMVNEDEPRNATFVEAGQVLSAMDPPPDFVVSTGDNIDDLFCLPSHTAADADIPVLTLYRDLIDTYFPMPFYVVLGNHDNRYFDTFDGNEDAWRAWLRAFEGTESLPAPYFAVDHGGFRFVVLACTDEAYDHDSNDLCLPGEEQLAWLDAQLAEGLPTVLFWHQALTPPDELTEDSHVLFHSIAPHADTVRAVFTGHRHRFAHFVWLGIDFWETDSFKSAVDLPYHLVRCDATDGSVTVLNEERWDYVTE